MLFFQSNSLNFRTGARERLRLVGALEAGGRAPLLGAARRRLFRSLVPKGDEGFDSGAAAELEREWAARQESNVAGVPGELFCAEDCVFTLLFGETVSAGVVYGLGTAEPLARLERFCRDAREALIEARGGGAGTAAGVPEWQARAGRSTEGLARFMAVQPADFVRAAAALRSGRELTRASELMEEPTVRSFLRRVQEMRGEGYTPRRLFAEAGALSNVSVEMMLSAGLLEREVRVSCRKAGHALFDLPSPDSLAAITISRAKCSLCAAPVADEVIEETLNPTRLAVSLLEDGRWLGNRVYQLVRSLGVPDSDIATGPASPHGESCLAVDVCGHSFIFVTRDGDLTPAFSRRVVEAVEEADSAHLVVVLTGAAEDEGQMRLYEFAWRRARAGRDLDLTVVEGFATARAQIERAFGRVVHRELSRHLFPLDAALGFSAGNFVLAWFKQTQAASAARPHVRPRAHLPAALDQQVAS